MPKKYFPNKDNLGQNYLYWAVGGLATGCCYSKAELAGRRSCEGAVDDVCLYVRDGRTPVSLSNKQIANIKTSVPNLHYNNLPPGDTV